jgi:hypothetical protein
MRRTNPSIPTQIPLFSPAADVALRIELTAAQQHELIRALAELLLCAAGGVRARTQEGGPDDHR